MFQKSLSMANRTKSVTWTQIYDAGPTRKVFELPDGGRIRLVEISETPTYDCGMVSSRDICMHVIWVMLRKLNGNENDDIIQQKSIPVARVKRLLRSEEHAVSSGVTASLTSGVSAATTALSLSELYHFQQVQQPSMEVSYQTVEAPQRAELYFWRQVQQPSVGVSSTTMESPPRAELCHLRQVQQPSVEVFYQTVEAPQRAELYHLRQVQQPSVEVSCQTVEAPQQAELYHLR